MAALYPAASAAPSAKYRYAISGSSWCAWNRAFARYASVGSPSMIGRASVKTRRVTVRGTGSAARSQASG